LKQFSKMIVWITLLLATWPSTVTPQMSKIEKIEKKLEIALIIMNQDLMDSEETRHLERCS